jgi:hypothetical protein
MDRKLSFRKGLYTDHVAKLVAACNWLGIDRGRAAQYTKLVREFFEDNARSKHHILAYGESCEIVDLFELWEHRATAFPGLAEKIGTACNKGALLREEEKPAAASNRARNYAFAYLVAGKLLAAGVPVIAVDGVITRDVAYESEADVTFRWDGTLIDIECKRPQSYATLVERTKEARHQIERPSRGGRHGAIALDCSVLIRPAGTLLNSDSEEAAASFISTKLEQACASKVESYLTPSIAGFLFFARVPVMSRVGRSPIVTSLAKPIYDFRPDAISTMLVQPNLQYDGPDILRSCLAAVSEAPTPL